MNWSETERLVLEYHVSGWPVSEIDRKLGLDDGASRRIVVESWRRDRMEWEQRKLRRVYMNGGA